MKVKLALIFVALTTFNGNPNGNAQRTIIVTNKIMLATDSLKTVNDSMEKKYFIEIKKTEKLTDQLIAKKKEVDTKNLQLHAEIKRLKKINDYLKLNVDTVFIHDTIFKRRKILQIFKK